MRRRSVALATALALLLALHAPLHAAAWASPAEPSGLGKVLTYAGCALAIINAANPLLLAGAVILCGSVFHSELAE